MYAGFAIGVRYILSGVTAVLQFKGGDAEVSKFNQAQLDYIEHTKSKLKNALGR